MPQHHSSVITLYHITESPCCYAITFLWYDITHTRYHNHDVSTAYIITESRRHNHRHAIMSSVTNKSRINSTMFQSWACFPVQVPLATSALAVWSTSAMLPVARQRARSRMLRERAHCRRMMRAGAPMDSSCFVDPALLRVQLDVLTRICSFTR